MLKDILRSQEFSNCIVIGVVKKKIFENCNGFNILSVVINDSNYENFLNYCTKGNIATVKVKGDFREGSKYLFLGKWDEHKEYGYSLISIIATKLNYNNNIVFDTEAILNRLSNAPYFIEKKVCESILSKIPFQQILETVENKPLELYSKEIINFDYAQKLEHKKILYTNCLLIKTLYDNILKTGDTLIKKENLNNEYLLELLPNIQELDEFDEDSLFDLILIDNILRSKFCIENDRISLTKIRDMEFNIALNILKLSQNNFFKISKSKLERQIITMEKKFSKENGFEFKFAEKQKEAICSLNKSNFIVITGGPGTGKSTAIKGVLEILNLNYPDCITYFCAPTGRAAKRMTETTGKKAFTIHKLFKYGKNGEFAINDNNKLECDVLVIDESSMIDTFIMNTILNGTKEKTLIILLGDVHQLPPIGMGYPLKDIIESNATTVTTLNKTFRQSGESLIITNAYKILDGDTELLSREEDFEIISIDSEISTSYSIVDTFQNYLIQNDYPNNISILNDIQILIPMNKKTLGVHKINKSIQAAINPKKSQEATLNFTRDGVEFELRKNDKVMQTSNNYTKNTFNGDTGYVKNILQNSAEIVFFGEEQTVHIYSLDELSELALAYAITIHKSQGSEYKVALVVNSTTHRNMLQRNLLYTAITRAKQKVYLFSDTNSVEYSINNNNNSKRYTFLKPKLKKLKKEQCSTDNTNNTPIQKKQCFIDTILAKFGLKRLV